MTQTKTKFTFPKNAKLPNHVVLIPDGNRRWARAQNKYTLLGHKKGFDVAYEVTKIARQMGIHTLTIWAFSTGNWDRTQKEISYLMRLYARMVDQHLKEAIKDKVRIVHLGRKDRIPDYLRKKIADAEAKTKKYTKNILNIALDYGGHDDVIRNLSKADVNTLSSLTEEKLGPLLDTSGQPYPNPDLIIRTSGEQRTSGILCWQADQAEMYWLTDHFPDFTPEKFHQAMLDYSRRRRRFGGNDKELHLKFDPKKAAAHQLKWWQAHHTHDEKSALKSFLNLSQEIFNLPKNSLKKLETSFLKATAGRYKNSPAKFLAGMTQVYKIIQEHTGFTFDPEYLARLDAETYLLHDQLENDIDKQPLVEHYTQVTAETFRLNAFQATEPARLFVLALSYHDLAEKTDNDSKTAQQYWNKTQSALEQYFHILKQRVA